MIRPFSALAVVAGLALCAAAPSFVQAQSAPTFRLMPADQIETSTHLILTVPLDEPAALATTASDIEARFGVTFAAEWPLQSIDVHCFVVEAGADTDVDALVQQMQADARIRTVQRMQDFATFEAPYPDTLFPIQSALTELNAPAAQRLSMGAGIRVGVVDSAIDGMHPDLSSRVVDLRDFVGDGQGQSGEPHGTAIAGIIAADASNATGMVGVAPDADLVGLRACWQHQGDAGRCNSFSLARAINFAILNDIDVLNLSLGGPPDPLLEELVDAAIASGIKVVAAWGETDLPVFPASVSGVIAAGHSADHRIPAPSVDVISAAPHSEFRYVSGSSVAAAHVSGVVALMLAADAGLAPADVLHALQASVIMHDDLPMLDACKALNLPGDSQASCAP